jgi:hypothetical protein
MTIHIGFAQAPITPSLDRPVFLAGFGRDRRAESVHDPLTARALAVDNDGRLLIIIALDLISLHRGQCGAIAARVAARLPGAATLVACTHTHHGPDTLGLWGPDEMTPGVDPVYMAGLMDTIEATAVAAAAERHEAHLAAASTVVTGVAKNFRDPAITDEELTCLGFRRPDGRPLATWLIYPCHPEVLWDENPHMTADYIHSLRREVEAATGAPCLVHVGALGGMMSPDVVDHSFEEAEAMGVTLAAAALATLAEADAVPVDRVAYDRHEYAIPMANPLFEAAAAIGLLPDVKRPDGTVLTEAALLRFDDVWLFAVPGELLPKLGLRYREMLRAGGARLTGIIGLANDELGYILAAEDFRAPADYFNHGDSYEESMSIGPTAGPDLTAALAHLIAQATG